MAKRDKIKDFRRLRDQGSQRDPICGMDVTPEIAIKKGLVLEKDGKTNYFCSSKCKDEFIKGKKWYEGNMISYALSVVLVAVAGLVLWTGNMLPFMGIVFLLLAGLKFLDLKGFANAFGMYDLIAKRSKIYGLAYPFIELALGVAFLFAFQIKIAAVVTIIIMTIGTIVIARNLMSKEKVKCACLGTKIKVPLTTFTLVEDIVMALMGVMILVLL